MRAQVVAHERGAIAAEVAARRVREPAAGQRPVAGHGRERGQRAQRHPAARVALDPHRRADRRRTRERDPLAERLDPRDRHVADLRRARGRERADPLARTRPSRRSGRAGTPRRARRGGPPRASAPSASAASVPGRGARCSSAWRARARPDRVDHDDVRALLARRGDELPDVVMARERVGAPQQDQPRVPERLRVHAAVGAGRVAQAVRRRRSSRCSGRACSRRARSTAARPRGPRAPGGSRASRSPGTARSPRRRAGRGSRAAARRSRRAPRPSRSARTGPRPSLRRGGAGAAGGRACACGRGSGRPSRTARRA